MKNSAHHPTPRGFTMIELMVAIAISAFLMVVLAQVYASTKRTYRINEGLSRMQETGRYTVDLISRDMRLAGYMGCVGSTTNISNMANPVSGWTPLNTTTSPPSIEGVIGYEQSGLPTSGTAFALVQAEVNTNTDVVQIQHLSATSAKLINPSPTNANIQISGNPLSFQPYEVLIVTDCTWADIFKATSISTSSGTVTIAHSSSNNTSNTTSVNYGENAEVMRFETNVYYVGADPQSTAGPCPPNTLCRKRLGLYLTADTNKWCTNATSSTTQGLCVEQIAEGVEDLQILYGIDNNGDLSADVLVPASSITTNNCTTSTTCWPNVVSMRINVLLRSTDTNLQPQAVTTYPASQIPLFNGSPPTITSATSRAYRRVHTETINLRNRTL